MVVLPCFSFTGKQMIMRRIYFTLAFILWAGTASAQTFTLKSNDLGGHSTNRHELNGFGCDGENKSPHLSWENIPEGTGSFAVTIFDENAPTGSGWWHWVIFDIPGNITALKSDAGNKNLKNAPHGSIQSVTDFKTAGYGGPCPPEGEPMHKYVVTVYALKGDKLGLDESANAALVGFMLNQNLISKASLIFYYKR
jgi:Raf kinase inhibitor-like YbhB/YbcL family protein